LYYYFSVLCKSFKELFLLLRDFPKADAKVQLFLKTPKLFGGFFTLLTKKTSGIDLCQVLTSRAYLILYMRAKAGRSGQARTNKKMGRPDKKTGKYLVVCRILYKFAAAFE